MDKLLGVCTKVFAFHIVVCDSVCNIGVFRFHRINISRPGSQTAQGEHTDRQKQTNHPSECLFHKNPPVIQEPLSRLRNRSADMPDLVNYYTGIRVTNL